MLRFALAMIACLLLSLPASAATILFPDPVSTQTEVATDEATLLSAILSSVSFVASEPQNFEASEGFPLYVSVVVSKGDPVVVVPEPSTASLLGLGLAYFGLVGLTDVGRRRSA